MTYPQQPGPDDATAQQYYQPGGASQTGPALGPPVAASRKTKPLLWILSGIAAVLVLCCGIGIVGALTSQGGEKPVDSSASATPRPSVSSSAVAAPAVAPTTSPAPPPTSAAPPPPSPSPPAPKPKVYTGRGDDVIKVGNLTDLAVVKFSCPRCTSNTVLKSDGPDGLLVNEIGAYTGKRWINLEEDSLTTQFEVETSGKWTLTIGSVGQMATQAASGKASGRGDDVIVLGGDAETAKITHSKGQGNFAVHAYNLETGEGGLLVNEIGGYSGTRPLEAPALVQVTADGNWSINPV
ncbi:hypothetical protein [Micromonospora sp. WMMC250]|uniref:hypothetical protein n=1 Tax=Micromonospora sp. WMMC250 TaxID=3014781 RepID=UPI0022B6C32B|nr:hypothetical protein [Micromonospora sp. WMMC250]MCZ7379050.1 hypothetical protein [Micromonospora sp. WMMC250]